MKRIIVFLSLLLISCGKKSDSENTLSYQEKKTNQTKESLMEKEYLCFQDIKKASFKEGLSLGKRCPHLKEKIIQSYTRDQRLEILSDKRNLNKKEKEQLEELMKSYDQDQEKEAFDLLERAYEEMERA